MLWIFNKRKIIEAHRREACIKTCQLIADNTKSKITKKGWECDADINGGELADIIDNELNALAALAQK